MINQRGSFYVEIMVSLIIVGVIGTSFMPVLPTLLKKTQTVIRLSRLHEISQYVGNYIFQWASFEPESRLIPFYFYNNGSELEISGEKRVNKLLWAQPPNLEDVFLTDFYKVSIIFQNMSTEKNRATLNVVVWYDEDLDNSLNNAELSISF